VERLAILEEGREVSHLAVRLDRPAGRAAPPFTFLYLHGFGSVQSGEKAEFFRRQAVGAGFPFCSFDFQGHGESGGGMRGLTLSRNLADTARVHEWLRAAGLGRICLLGSSMGGATGMWYAAAHPEDVVAGLHIAPALGLEQALAAWAGPRRLREWEETGVIDFANEFVSCELGWELMADLRAHDAARLLATYRTPTLVLQGKHDDSVPWRDVVEAVTGCPYEGIELHLFADGDHRLTDRTARLWELMLEFLRGRGLL
jgi:pimeloyl-ACP methyl ester carboxylesterase